ncbi:MAG: aminotransferase class V-fold PLP-dependent enzyme [Alphaproteobacteria bacterium]|nr:aminotransferase class V-fold PLP-dependent enzyme [Alphaproteobacteria bacterium]
MTRHYLDHNATSPVRPEVVEAVADAMRYDGNSSSVHEEGRAARARVEDAREKVRRLVNAPVNGVIFTSGGTEAIHYALHGAALNGAVKKIFVSTIEHAAVPANASTTGLPVEKVPARPNGLVDLEALKSMAAKETEPFLFCLMLANNETGAIQPVREAADIVHDAGGFVFVDAAQAVGKIPTNYVMLGADFMAMTGHKFGGPVGVGALIVGPNLPLAPVMRGGGHEMNRRAGTHNVPAIVGLGVACDLAARSLERAREIATLRDRMQAAAVAAGARAWGAEVDRLPGTLCLTAPGFTGETQLMAMDLAGIAISSGSACSSGKAKPSHVLGAMGCDEAEAKCGVRISLGWSSTEEDADAFCREWPAAYERAKSQAA